MKNYLIFTSICILIIILLITNAFRCDKKVPEMKGKRPDITYDFIFKNGTSGRITFSLVKDAEPKIIDLFNTGYFFEYVKIPCGLCIVNEMWGVESYEKVE